MVDPKSLHDDEWRTGWKSDPNALAGEKRFHLIAEIASAYLPGSVFDLGCGDGMQAKVLREATSDIVINGCDISPTAVERSKQFLDSVYIHNIDEGDLPEESGSYDLVLCIAVLEHLFDIGHSINEIQRILKPGGYAIIQVPNLSFWRFRLDVMFGKIPSILSDPRHLQCFNRQFLVDILENVRLVVEQVLGRRDRLRFLARLSPGLFSEDIYILVRKESRN